MQAATIIAATQWRSCHIPPSHTAAGARVRGHGCFPWQWLVHVVAGCHCMLSTHLEDHFPRLRPQLGLGRWRCVWLCRRGWRRRLRAAAWSRGGIQTWLERRHRGMFSGCGRAVECCERRDVHRTWHGLQVRVACGAWRVVRGVNHGRTHQTTRGLITSDAARGMQEHCAPPTCTCTCTSAKVFIKIAAQCRP